MKRFFRGGWWLGGWPPVAGWLVASHHLLATNHQKFNLQVPRYQDGWWLGATRLATATLVAGGSRLVASGLWLVACGWRLVFHK